MGIYVHTCSCSHCYYYSYILEIGGKEAPATPNREIGFSFVSCSCRACVRACEAVWVREAGVPNAGRSDGEISCDSSSGAGFGFSFCGAICVGFKAKTLIWATLAWL